MEAVRSAYTFGLDNYQTLQYCCKGYLNFNNLMGFFSFPKQKSRLVFSTNIKGTGSSPLGTLINPSIQSIREG